MSRWPRSSFARFAGALVLAAGLTSSAGIGAAGGRIDTTSVPSPLLGQDIRLAVYVPETAQQAAPGALLPVLYLLHGRDDTERAWLDKGAIAGTLDRLIAERTLQPLIVVMPFAGNSWYVDDARADGWGPVEQAFTRDLVAAIEARYPVARCRAGRAVAGLSMGGYGAILFSVMRPDLYTAAVSLSGSLFSDDRDEISRRLPALTRIKAGVHGTPLDIERLRAWTVFQRLAEAPTTVADVAYWLGAGDEDFPSIISGTARFHVELRSRRMTSELRVEDGGHTWALWRRMIAPALAWLSPRLETRCGAAPAVGPPSSPLPEPLPPPSAKPQLRASW